jgi:hypothetical protein
MVVLSVCLAASLASAATEAGQAEEPEAGSPKYETEVRAPALAEEDLVGGNEQPLWTAARRFPTTRIYVLPPGTVELEWWLEQKYDMQGDAPRRLRSAYELEFGLPGRLQLDMYLVTQQLGASGPLELYQEKVELRWAFARWGVIPTNPTIYVEWVHQHEGPDLIEAKLLLGGRMAPRWHWGVNLVFEHELSGPARANEYALTTGFAYTVIDMCLSIGIELKGEMVDEDGRRWAFANWEVLGGPSIQWRPVRRMHIDLVALFGAEIEEEDGHGVTSPIAEPLLIVGWSF